MLWHIEGTTIHFLGSVHVTDTPLNLNGRIAQELDKAEILAFEANFDVCPDGRMGLYNSNRSLSDEIESSLFEDAKSLWLELNLEEQMLERNRPWSAAFTLMNALLARSGFQNELGVDRVVLNFGKRQRKSLFFLEGTVAGLVPFARSPLTEQELFLSRVVRHTEEGLAEVASIAAAWKANQPMDLLPILDRSLRLMPTAYTSAIMGRNRAWIPQLLRLARTGKNTVVVVGALHMVGVGGLPAILEERGLRCTFIENRDS